MSSAGIADATRAADVRMNHTDSDLTFFALAYKDYGDLRPCVRDLRRSYPTARVVLRSDGDPDPRFPLLARRYRADFLAESRLFGVENGGAVIERMLELSLERPTRYLFKIDPDTVIHRRFRHLPGRGGLFGTPQGDDATPAIQGGCMGFTRDAAEQILQSGMLRDRRLCEPANFVDESPYLVKMAGRAARCGLASFDWGLAWVAAELGIPLFAFDEVNSGWLEAPRTPRGRLAVTHPRTTRAYPALLGAARTTEITRRPPW